MPRIRVTAHQGEVKVEGVGFKGASCVNAMAFLKKALGEVEEQHTADFYIQEDPVEIIQELKLKEQP